MESRLDGLASILFSTFWMHCIYDLTVMSEHTRTHTHTQSHTQTDTHTHTPLLSLLYTFTTGLNYKLNAFIAKKGAVSHSSVTSYLFIIIGNLSGLPQQAAGSTLHHSREIRFSFYQRCPLVVLQRLCGPFRNVHNTERPASRWVVWVKEAATPVLE